MAKKLLAPGMTKLGSMKVSIKQGPQQDVDIYYGNIFWDQNNNAHKLPDKNYREKLDKYLNEHPDYKRPTDQELIEDFKRARVPGSPGSIPPSQRQNQANPVNTQPRQQMDQAVSMDRSGGNHNMQNNAHQNNYDDADDGYNDRNRNRRNRRDYDDYDDYDDDDDYDDLPKRRKIKKSKKIKLPVKQDRYNDDYDESDYDNDDEQDNDSDDYESAEHSKAVTMTVVALVSIVCNIFLYACLQGILPFFNNNRSKDKETAPTYEVVQISKDLTQGDVITKDDLKEVTITEKQYKDRSSGKYVKSDGTVDDNTVILWDNRNDAVGKYVNDSMKEGDYLTTSNISELKDGETSISLDLNGQKVTVPVNVTTAGNSEIHLYAICTTTNEDKSKKTAAVDLGTFKLEGRTLSDILNSEGQSKLNEYLSEADKSKN